MKNAEWDWWIEQYASGAYCRQNRKGKYVVFVGTHTRRSGDQQVPVAVVRKAEALKKECDANKK